MSAEYFRRIRHDSEAMTEFEESTIAGLRQVPGFELISGRLVSYEITAAPSSVDIAHGLGKKWTGFILVDNSAVIDVYSESTQTDRSKYITLHVSATGDIKLWVF